MAAILALFLKYNQDHRNKLPKLSVLPFIKNYIMDSEEMMSNSFRI